MGAAGMKGWNVYYCLVRPWFWLLLLSACLSSVSCSGITSRKYEYEEEIFLSLDGSATVYVNAAVPALVSLRGAALPVDSSARLDRTVVREWYESPVAHVVNVTASRRDNRRYVHVRLNVPDIRKLNLAPAFAWSTYAMKPVEGLFEYTQNVGGVPAKDVGQVGWTGKELVAVRLHVPSQIRFHNAPSKRTERGNILVWEQTLIERQKGIPVQIEVRMDQQSILIRTLGLFAAMAVAVVITFVVVIWFVRRRGSPDHER